MSTDQLRQDMNYVASALRRRELTLGTPSIYFLWAAIIAVGFAMPDFAPQRAGLFWLVFGIGGGALSMWLGYRDDRNSGERDATLGKRHGLHWAIGGAGYLLTVLAIVLGRIDPVTGGQIFLLLTGLIYAFAGVHLLRPLLWSGLLMLGAFAAMVIFQPPYAWTLTGILLAITLAWSGALALRARRSGTPE